MNIYSNFFTVDNLDARYAPLHLKDHIFTLADNNRLELCVYFEVCMLAVLEEDARHHLNFTSI